MRSLSDRCAIEITDNRGFLEQGHGRSLPRSRGSGKGAGGGGRNGLRSLPAVMGSDGLEIARWGAFVCTIGVAVLLQKTRPWREMRGSTTVNLAFWLAGAVLTAAVCGSCTVGLARWCASGGLGLFHQLSAPLWVTIPVTVAGLDLISYLWHRWNHSVVFLWRFHRVHHSDTAFTVSTAARFHPGELLLSFPLRLAGVAVLGAPPVAVAVFEIVFAAFNFLEHGNIAHSRRLERRLGTVFILPSLHRRHHSRRWEELNSNYGTIFSLWDHVFGTYGESPDAASLRIGLPGMQAPLTVAAAMALPARAEFGQPPGPVA